MGEIRERRSLRNSVLAGLLLASTTTLFGQSGTALAAPVGPVRAAGNKRPAPQNKAVDPEVMKSFEKMGAFLRSMTSLHLTAETMTDEVSDSGQKLQISAVVDLFARRPDRLRVDIVGDRMRRELYYDGKTFTQYAPDLGYYAAFDAPPTIAEVMDKLEERYGIELPLQDLFYWGTDKFDTSQVLAATDVGPSRVTGFDCEHLAFRQKDVDWQVWLAKGPQPFPLKFVVTTTTQKAQPEYIAVLRWDLSTNAPDATYQFVPPKGAHQIQFETVE
jgi:hypothetical protein